MPSDPAITLSLRDLLEFIPWWIRFTFEIIGFIALLWQIASGIQKWLQNRYGAPDLVIGFNTAEHANATYLVGQLLNPAVQGLLGRAGIKRKEIGDLIVTFGIRSENRNNVVMNPIVPFLNLWGPESGFRIKLAASRHPAVFYIVEIDANKNVITCVANNRITLEPGRYEVIVEAEADGEHYDDKRIFGVQKTSPYAYWL